MLLPVTYRCKQYVSVYYKDITLRIRQLIYYFKQNNVMKLFHIAIKRLQMLWW